MLHRTESGDMKLGQSGSQHRRPPTSRTLLNTTTTHHYPPLPHRTSPRPTLTRRLPYLSLQDWTGSRRR